MYKNLAATLVAACFISPVFSQSPAPGAPPLKIGFVYVAPVTEAGWVHQHDEGRKAVEAALGDQVKTTYVENVAEGTDAERVIRDLASQGHRLIFTPSFGYMESTLKVAKDFPNVRFESITGYKTAPNVAVANARYYEGRYLAGIAAGRLTRSAGYVAGFPIPEVIQGINAFTLAITHQWGGYYTRRAQAVLDGSWKSGAFWGGVKEGMIRVDSFGPRVPRAVADEVLARQRDIAAGRLHPFQARTALLDNEGHEVLAAGRTLSDAQILNMNFLVQGVQGKLTP
ncbi:BMP family ABC transporter substrate-binding protein [soil metagenome]